MLTRTRLAQILERLPSLTLGLVGDLYLDRYLELAPGVTELSIETGLEAYQIETVRNSPGALGTVMNNLAALGVGRLVPATVIGDDGHGYDLLAALRALPVSTEYILRDARRLTPTYTKPMRPVPGEPARELNRLDVRSRVPLPADLTAALAERITRMFREVDGVVVLDQVAEANWGVVNESIRSLLARLAEEHRDKIVCVDSRSFIGRFAGAVVKGNRSEIVGTSSSGAGAPEACAAELARRNGRPVFCTCGEEGILVAQPTGAVTHVPGFRVSGPVDIVGAGDSVTSGTACALICGASAEEAALVGNLTASITVQQLGTTGTASPAQMLARYDEYVAQQNS